MNAHKDPQPAPIKSGKKLTNGRSIFHPLTGPASMECIPRGHWSPRDWASLGSLPKSREQSTSRPLINVLEVLNPDRKLEDACAYCQNSEKRMKSPQKLCKKCPANVNLELPKNTPVLHPDELPHKEKRPSTKSCSKIFLFIEKYPEDFINSANGCYFWIHGHWQKVHHEIVWCWLWVQTNRRHGLHEKSKPGSFRAKVQNAAK